MEIIERGTYNTIGELRISNNSFPDKPTWEYVGVISVKMFETRRQVSIEIKERNSSSE